MTEYAGYSWAKLDVDGNALPLVDHADDVASVLTALLSNTIWFKRLVHCAERPLSEQDIARLGALGFIHDLGKANYGFWARQFPGKPPVGHTRETAALFFGAKSSKHPTSLRLQNLIESWEAEQLFLATMAHHGAPLDVYADNSDTRKNVPKNREPDSYWHMKEEYDPMSELDRLLDAAETRFPAAFSTGLSLPQAAPFVSLLCGLLTLADWIGSDTTLFPITSPYGSARHEMRTQAITSATTGRGLAKLDTPSVNFSEVFDGKEPRGLQSLVDHPQLGAIALLEAETGSGKTEAALWRWLSLRKAGLVDGLYFALPTRSAAVQLHARVQRMLNRVFGAHAVEAVLAVPGYLRAGDAEGQALPDFKVIWDDAHNGDGHWAAERPKRFLAARVAVGTIDQVLMAGLQLRHAHLRASALSRSLLVVDEVHASDAFMGTILEQVLKNHKAFGGHALLLSATLSSDARARLLDLGEQLPLHEACAVPYPLLSGNARKTLDLSNTHQEKSPTIVKTVRLEPQPIINNPSVIAQHAIEAARAGASVLVIRNSVAGAIAVAKEIEDITPDLTFSVSGVSTLHHGRFSPEDRRLLDAGVEAAFDKNRSAKGRILCGSQTLEQSLDIDADLLLTDLAPMDVLLQRIGRLHRHQRNDRATFHLARTIVLVPESDDLSIYLRNVRERNGLGPRRDGTGVYPDLIALEATRRLILKNPMITIPNDNRRLVENALHPDVATALQQELGAAWINHGSEQVGTAMAERGLANSWKLDLSTEFTSLNFPGNNEKITTRLGARDRIVYFEPTIIGPFGRPIGQLAIPAWMAGDVSIDAVPIVDTADEGTTHFHLEDRRFCYGRWGLELLGSSK